MYKRQSDNSSSGAAAAAVTAAGKSDSLTGNEEKGLEGVSRGHGWRRRRRSIMVMNPAMASGHSVGDSDGDSAAAAAGSSEHLTGGDKKSTDRRRSTASVSSSSNETSEIWKSMFDSSSCGSFSNDESQGGKVDTVHPSAGRGSPFDMDEYLLGSGTTPAELTGAAAAPLQNDEFHEEEETSWQPFDSDSTDINNPGVLLNLITNMMENEDESLNNAPDNTRDDAVDEEQEMPLPPSASNDPVVAKGSSSSGTHGNETSSECRPNLPNKGAETKKGKRKRGKKSTISKAMTSKSMTATDTNSTCLLYTSPSPRD